MSLSVHEQAAIDRAKVDAWFLAQRRAAANKPSPSVRRELAKRYLTEAHDSGNETSPMRQAVCSRLHRSDGSVFETDAVFGDWCLSVFGRRPS